MRPIVLAALVGCISNEKALTLFDDDGDGAYTEYAAAYGGTAPWDCDDSDPAAHPGAAEACGGGDENCDGSVDEAGATGETTWYHDVDGDGYGDINNAVDACTAPEGYVATADDCDDNELAAHPGATEACNGFDDNCDGHIDEAGAVGGAVWYRDADKDGHGDPSETVTACNAPAGYVGSSDDCDDTNDKTAPGKPEICNDGSDNNCNGSVDQCRLSGTIDLATKASQTLFGQNTSDHLGIAAVTGDFNHDGIDDLAIATEGPSSGDGGGVRITFGGSGFDIASPAQANIAGVPASARPLVLCAAPLTGDGVDDLVVGWGRSSGDHPDYAVYSGTSLNGSTIAGSGAHYGSTTSSALPQSIACGALKHDAGDALFDAGGTSAWFYGPLTTSQPLTSPNATESTNGFHALDIDGDGSDDLWQHTPGAQETRVFYGPVGSTATADLTLSGSGGFAEYVDAADLTGDGHPDLLATDINAAATKGGAHIWYGSETPLAGTLTGASANRDILGISTITVLSWAAYVGDVDGDDTPEVVASGLTTPGAPALGWLFDGASLLARDGVAGQEVTLTIPPLMLGGVVVARSGDWNGDGHADLAWLAPNAQANNGAGAVYLVLGQGL